MWIIVAHNSKILLQVIVLINVLQGIGDIRVIIRALSNVLMESMVMKELMKEHAILQLIYQDMRLDCLVIHNLRNIYLSVLHHLNSTMEIEL